MALVLELVVAVDEDLWTHHPTRPTEVQDRRLRLDMENEKRTAVEMRCFFWMFCKVGFFFFNPANPSILNKKIVELIRNGNDSNRLRA